MNEHTDPKNDSPLNSREDDQRNARKIARLLLDIGAVSLRPEEPFVWSSGWKSPIYCDNRLTMSFPEVRSQIADMFAEEIRNRHADIEVIAGVATGGIPHAAWVADRLKLPMVYIRDKAKGHGKQNQIEGLLKPGSKTVVIEDLISTGGSSLRAARAVQEAGGEVLSVAAIFSYEFEHAQRAFAAENMAYWSLGRYSVLLDEALKTGHIRPEHLEQLKAWNRAPESYGK
jgi:orotate phosphoribosyltransferase